MCSWILRRKHYESLHKYDLLLYIVVNLFHLPSPYSQCASVGFLVTVCIATSASKPPIKIVSVLRRARAALVMPPVSPSQQKVVAPYLLAIAGW
jgi:hypothetical protein